MRVEALNGRICRSGGDGIGEAVTGTPAGLVRREGGNMAGSVYKVIELVGTSPESWEKAAKAAIEMAAQTLRDLRIAEVMEMDMQIEDGKITNYRTKIRLSFKYEGKD